MLTFKPINAHLQIEADSIERNAKESLKCWIVLGQTQRYFDEMRKVDLLRRAMTLRGLRVRAEFLSDL